MAYEEYDYYNEPSTGSLRESLYEILHGLKDPQKLREAGEGLGRVRDIIPNVVESLARGGIGQAIGTSGDLREIRNTINSYLPKGVQNFTQAAEFLANPYATAIQQTAPTTEQVLETVPRATAPYEGYKQHETLGEFVAPALGYFGVKALKAAKDLPGGLSIMGPESKLWEPAMAFEAAKMEAKGVPADEIKRVTGMARGLDTQWRQELSDFWSFMKHEGNFGEVHGKIAKDKEPLVSDILEHPELMKAYPELGDIKVIPVKSTENFKGSYDPLKNEISLREDLSPAEARSVITHELNHVIQIKEGMNVGGNPEDMAIWLKEESQARMALAQEKLDALDVKIAERRASGISDDDLMQQKFNATNEFYDAKKFGERDAYEDYKRLAGEAEARMVQARMGLTESQLREYYPYEKSQYGLDIDPDLAIQAKYAPDVLKGPAKSAEPPISKKDELGFYSLLENAILKIGQPKGTGEQFLKQLEKTPGVKTEELDVSGVKQYLLDHPNVTKQELLDYMGSSRLKLENKILDEGTGQGNAYEEYQLQGGDIYHNDDYIRGMADDLHYDMKNDDVIRSQERQALLEADPERYADYDTNPYSQARLEEDIDGVLWDNAKEQAEQMYYENPIRHYYDEHGYDIYGNDDLGYTIKDPQGRFLDIGGRNGLYDFSDAENALRSHLLEDGTLSIDEEGAAKYADYVLPGKHENYREILTTLPQKHVKDFDYSSGHFDEPNVLAHMRVNDRTINGKKTLMVEEIQSDWHQAGRRKGYASEASKERKAEIEYQLGKLNTDKSLLRDYRDAAGEQGNLVQKLDYDQQLARLERQQVELRSELQGTSGVPDAPFKKNWHEMMVKQALETAAKGDYEAIAFTTGKQQADRYNLSKHIESLSYNPETNQLWAYKEGGHSPIIDKTVEPDKLHEYVGEEIAKKLLKKELESVPTNNGVVQLQQLSGLDLETGGEGMKGFYDKIIPDYINKYGKKWGIGMKKVNLDSNGNQYNDFKDWVIAKDPSMNETFINDSFFKSDDLFKEWLRSGKKSGEEVHFVELSDAAKKDIKEKGQPMFAGIGLGLGTDYMMEPDDQMKTGIFKDLIKAKN